MYCVCRSNVHVLSMFLLICNSIVSGCNNMIEFIVARLQHGKEHVNTQPSSRVILFNSRTVTDVYECTNVFLVSWAEIKINI